jgi:hypothetical protein
MATVSFRICSQYISVEVEVIKYHMKCYKKAPGLLLLVPWWKKIRREAKVTSQVSGISLPRDTLLWIGIGFYTSAYSTLCFILSAMDDKI